jgi:quinol monooxygenase YgiN
MITALGICRAKPGQENELGRRMYALLAPTREEPGCLSYDLFRSTTDRAIWMLLESWISESAVEAHTQTAHFQAFLRTKDDVLNSDPDSYRFQAIVNKP